MKKILSILFLIFSSLFSFAQQAPALKIDNDTIYVNSDISFPYWLKEGQTIQPLVNIKTLSILEFDLDSSGNMNFSKVVIGLQGQAITVPSRKVWKMEAIGLKTAYSNSSTSQSTYDTSFQLSGFSNQNEPTANSPKKFLYAGTYNWVAPPNVTRICVEVWGAGGPGAWGTNSTGSGGGGGGGGYGYQCFTVFPMTSYNIIVGAGGVSTEGGASSFGTLISATGGKRGTNGNGANTGSGGIGGTSTAFYNYAGYRGGSIIFSSGSGTSSGGNSGDNTGYGGSSGANSSKDGLSPGGGGGGTTSSASGTFQGFGGDGRVIIYW